MEIDVERRPDESFKDYMDRILAEAKERYERMSPEDQKRIDEAASRHGDRARTEIMASFPDVPYDDTPRYIGEETTPDERRVSRRDQQPDESSDDK